MLEGGLRDGKMVLLGKRQTQRGQVIDRVTLATLPDGGVRQHWLSSANDGETRADVYDGGYQRGT